MCALLLGLVVAIPAQAETLTWTASVQEAATNNADLRVARANFAAADYNATAAYSGFYPQVSAGVGYSDVTGSAPSSGASTVPTGSGTTYNASVAVSQNLFAGFQDTARVEQGSASRAVADANLLTAKAKLSRDLKAAFAGLRYAQDSVTLAGGIVRRQEENVRLVELRFESGHENKGSFLLTRATLAQARLDALQAEQAVITARAQFAQALGRTEAGEIEASGDVPVAEPAGAPDFERLAMQTPDYYLVTAQERSAAAGVTLARAGFYPSLNLSGSVARIGGDWFPEGDRRTVGVNVTVPLFSGGKDYYGTRSAAASLDAASTSKQTVERQLLVSLKQAYATYVQSVEQLKVNEAFLDAAQTRADIARIQYNNGLISFSDWNLIENDLIQRQKSLVVSQRDRIVAEAAWEQVQGKGVIP